MSPVDISLMLIVSLVALESAVTATVLAETTKIRLLQRARAVADEASSATLEGPVGGAPIPEFSGMTLDADRVVTRRDLIGHSSAFLFVAASHALALQANILWAVIYGARKQIDHCLYVVCNGTRTACRSLRDRLNLQGTEKIEILLDEDAALTHVFGITRMPAAIVVDEEGIVSKLGRVALTDKSGERQ